MGQAQILRRGRGTPCPPPCRNVTGHVVLRWWQMESTNLAWRVWSRHLVLWSVHQAAESAPLAPRWRRLIGGRSMARPPRGSVRPGRDGDAPAATTTRRRRLRIALFTVVTPRCMWDGRAPVSSATAARLGCCCCCCCWQRRLSCARKAAEQNLPIYSTEGAVFLSPSLSPAVDLILIQ